MTGVTGDTTASEGLLLDTSITTQASQTIGRCTQLSVGEPDITIGSGATVTTSASLYVSGVATEAGTNLALWVDLGNTVLDGNLSVGGSLSKGSGTFNIEHPHPSKKNTHRLVHSLVESSEALLIYRSSVDLVDGTATVDLDQAAGMTDGTFVLLTREPQVFVTNDVSWSRVRGLIVGNQLMIECEDATTDRVNWLVVCNRQDEHMLSSDTEWTDDNGRPIIEPLNPASLK
jgi:hypothetical protein